MPIPPIVKTPRESLKTTRLWIRVGTWIIGLVVVLRAIHFLQSGGLNHALDGPSEETATESKIAYPLSNPPHSARILIDGSRTSAPKKDH